MLDLTRGGERALCAASLFPALAAFLASLLVLNALSVVLALLAA